MADNEKDKSQVLGVYSHLLAQVIFISASGIAAGVALTQSGVVKDKGDICLTISFILFAVSLILGVLSLMGLLGQADSEEPDIHNSWVRIPSFLTIICFIGGACLFTYAISINFLEKTPETKIVKAPISQTRIQPASSLDCYEKQLTEEQKQLLDYFLVKAFPGICGVDTPADKN